MIYKVSLKKLLTLANPYEQTAFSDMDRIVSFEAVRQALDEFDIFPDGTDVYQDHVRRIAWHVANPDTEAIHIDLGFPETGQSPEWIVKQGVYQLAASIYRGDKEILATIEGSEKSAKALLGIKLSDTHEIHAPAAPLDFKTINWDGLEELLSSTWKNEDFVFEKLDENYSYAFRTFAQELWYKPGFMEKLHRSFPRSIGEAPADILYSKRFIDFVAENPDLLHMSLKSLERIFSSHNTEDENYELYRDTLNYLKEKILSRKEHVSSLLNSQTQGEKVSDLCSVLAHVPEHIFHDEDILEDILKLRRHSDYTFRSLDFLPDSVYASSERIVQILHNTGYEAPGKIWNEINKHVTDLEKLIALSDKLEGQMLMTLLAKTEVRYEHSEELARLTIVKAPQAYNLFNKKLKNKNELIELYCQHGSDPSLLNVEYLKTIEDRELIKRFIHTKPEILLKIPEWKKDPELLIQAAHKFGDYDIKLSKTQWDYFSQPQFIEKLLEARAENYYFLNQEARHNPEVAMSFLAKKGSGYVSNVPKRLWANQEFCLQVLALYPDKAHNVPGAFWTQKSFIIELAQRVDSGLIQSEVLLREPGIRQLCEISAAGQGEYTSTINRYFLQQDLKKELPEVNQTVRKKLKV